MAAENKKIPEAHENDITSILRIDDAKLLICTPFGLFHFNQHTKLFREIDIEVTDSNLPISDLKKYKKVKNVHYCLEDRNGMIWLGTKQGLYRYDRFNNRLKLYLNDKNDPSSLQDNHIVDICLDKDDDPYDEACWTKANPLLDKGKDRKRIIIFPDE